MRRPAVHPDAGDGYAVLLIKRMTLAGKLYRAGAVVIITGRWQLKVAANLIAAGVARAADERTAKDAALLLELQRAATLVPPEAR